MTDQHLIVVADDNKDLAELIQLRFAAEKWRVVCASTGGEAFDAVARNRTSLVLLDIEMPGGGGLDTLAKLKADPRTRKAPVVMLTGRRGATDVQTAARSGAVDYIIKPFDFDTLVRRVRKHLVAPADAMML